MEPKSAWYVKEDASEDKCSSVFIRGQWPRSGTLWVPGAIQFHISWTGPPDQRTDHEICSYSIRNLLEVVVTDFSGTLAKVEIEVADAASE